MGGGAARQKQAQAYFASERIRRVARRGVAEAQAPLALRAPCGGSRAPRGPQRPRHKRLGCGPGAPLVRAGGRAGALETLRVPGPGPRQGQGRAACGMQCAAQQLFLSSSENRERGEKARAPPRGPQKRLRGRGRRDTKSGSVGGGGGAGRDGMAPTGTIEGLWARSKVRLWEEGAARPRAGRRAHSAAPLAAPRARAARQRPTHGRAPLKAPAGVLRRVVVRRRHERRLPRLDR